MSLEYCPSTLTYLSHDPTRNGGVIQNMTKNKKNTTCVALSTHWTSISTRWPPPSSSISLLEYYLHIPWWYFHGVVVCVCLIGFIAGQCKSTSVGSKNRGISELPGNGWRIWKRGISIRVAAVACEHWLRTCSMRRQVLLT